MEEKRKSYHLFMKILNSLLGDISSDELRNYSYHVYQKLLAKEIDCFEELKKILGNSISKKSVEEMQKICDEIHEWRLQVSEFYRTEYEFLTRKKKEKKNVESKYLREFSHDLQFSLSAPNFYEEEKLESNEYVFKLNYIPKSENYEPPSIQSNNIQKKKKTKSSNNSKWFLSLCENQSQLFKSTNPMKTEEIASSIIRILTETQDGATLENNLFEFLGVESLEFIQQIIEKKNDLLKDKFDFLPSNNTNPKYSNLVVTQSQKKKKKKNQNNNQNGNIDIDKLLSKQKKKNQNEPEDLFEHISKLEYDPNSGYAFCLSFFNIINFFKQGYNKILINWFCLQELPLKITKIFNLFSFQSKYNPKWILHCLFPSLNWMILLNWHSKDIKV